MSDTTVREIGDDWLVARIHHRCSACGGSGYAAGRDRDCPLCKGNGMSHATFSGFVPPGCETDLLMPDNRPLREVAIGNRRR